MRLACAPEVMLSLVVVATRGNDLVEPPMPGARYIDGDRSEPRGVRGARGAEMRSVAAFLAAEMLSLAICVTGGALGTRGHVPPYQLFVDRGYDMSGHLCIAFCLKAVSLYSSSHC